MPRRLPSDPLALFKRPSFPVRIANGVVYQIDSSRLGRRYVPFAHMLKFYRYKRQLQAQDLAKALGKSKSLISKLETETVPTKSTASTGVIVNLACVLGMDPVEAVLAYQAQQYPELRFLAYPDDPGESARALGLPPGGLTAAAARIRQRELWAGGAPAGTLPVPVPNFPQ